MNKPFSIGFLSLALTLCLAGCKNETAPTTAPGSKSAETNPAPASSETPGQSFAGRVVETMNSGGYTYIQVDTGKETIWAASTPFKVKVGDTVVIPPGMAMRNFHSSTLERDFDVIYFVNGVRLGNAPASSAETSKLPAGHPAVAGMPDSSQAKVAGIAKAEGGQTIAEIFAGKDELKGKTIKVRGKVVKFNANIMDKNWLHIQDGSGAPGTDDLTITTDAQVKVGDTVLVTGTLATDKDFGFNYQYAILVEEAKVAVE